MAKRRSGLLGRLRGAISRGADGAARAAAAARSVRGQVREVIERGRDRAAEEGRRQGRQLGDELVRIGRQVREAVERGEDVRTVVRDAGAELAGKAVSAVADVARAAAAAPPEPEPKAKKKARKAKKKARKAKKAAKKARKAAKRAAVELEPEPRPEPRKAEKPAPELAPEPEPPPPLDPLAKQLLEGWAEDKFQPGEVVNKRYEVVDDDGEATAFFAYAISFNDDGDPEIVGQSTRQLSRADAEAAGNQLAHEYKGAAVVIVAVRWSPEPL